MKRILVILMLSIPSITFAQVNSGELVIIKVIESKKGCFQDPIIHVTKPDGQYEVIELEHFKGNNYLTKDSKNQRVIHSKIKEFLTNGYEVKAHSSRIGDHCILAETYILSK